ncbi:histidine kinase [Rhizobium sp. GHKF11]|nr:histidine kinase [Rhizobium sp. GHKF11]
MLTEACRERMTATGATVGVPLRSARDVLDATMEGDVDAAIIDIGVDDDTLLSVSSILESANVPFLFASRAKGNSGGYEVSGDIVELRKIAEALFGPPGTSSTLHLIVDRSGQLFRRTFRR